MPSAIVLQHAAAEGPGAIGAALKAAGITPRIVRIDRGQPVPAELGDAAGLVVMGGPMGVYEADRYPHLRDELALIESALRTARPIVGICLGSQLLAAALGARVYPGARKELGWFDVTLGAAAADDHLWRGVASPFSALHWHGDVFDLPRGATLLASSAITPHQAFRYGDRAYGSLFHLEVTRPQLDRMVHDFADEIAAWGVAPAALTDAADARVAACNAIADVVFGRFATLGARGG
jgi:GMP synthase (glutamine-hydrolysing)